MIPVIGQFMAGERMYKHDQSCATDCQPRDNLAENLWHEGELATPVRVRAHGLAVHASHLDCEQPGSFGAKPACVIHGDRIKVHMGVVAQYCREGAWLGDRIVHGSILGLSHDNAGS